MRSRVIVERPCGIDILSLDYCQVVIPLLSLMYYLNTIYHFNVNIPIHLFLAYQSLLLICINIRCSPYHQRKTINLLIVDKSIIHQGPWNTLLIINHLEGKPTRPFFLKLEFLISMLQTICKTCLILPHYIIIVVASWNWYSTIRKLSLLHPANCASRLIVFIESLP